MYRPRERKENTFKNTLISAGVLGIIMLPLQFYGIKSNIPQLMEEEKNYAINSVNSKVYKEQSIKQEIELNKLRKALAESERKLTSKGKEDRLKEVTIKAINKHLEGLLVGQGKTIYEASQKFNVDSKLLTAIILLEVGKNCNSDVLKNAYNVAGINWKSHEQIRDKNGKAIWVKNTRPKYGWYIKYSSFEESINDLAQRLRWWYIDMNLKTIDDIGKKYAPINDSRDGIGGMNNKEWPENVTKFYNKILAEVTSNE